MSLGKSVTFKKEKHPSAFADVIANWRSFSYRQSGGLPENNRGKQFVHEHSDRHGISGKTSPSWLHLSFVTLLPLPLIFTHRKVSLLMLKKTRFGSFTLQVWLNDHVKLNTWATNKQPLCTDTKVGVLYHKVISIQQAVSLAMLITVICLPLMELVNQ